MDFWVNKKPATLGAGLSLHLKERSLICVTLIMLRRTPWGVVRAEKKAHSPSGPMGRTRRISSTTPLNLTRWVVLSLGPSTSQASALTELCTVPPLKIPPAVLEGSIRPLKRAATVVQLAVPQNTIHEKALLDGECLILTRSILIFLHVAPLGA